VATPSASFTGFGHEALQFLVDLAGNNERPWFQAHKQDYERHTECLEWLLEQALVVLLVGLNHGRSLLPARSTRNWSAS